MDVARFMLSLSVAMILSTIVLVTNQAAGSEFEDALGQLVNFRGRTGSAPTPDFYFSVIERESLTNEEQAALYARLVELQEPQVSMETLAAVLTSVRDSIRSFSCRYTYTNDPTASIHSYTFDRNKVIFEEPGPSSMVTFTTSYDGDLVRRVVRERGKMTNASIDTLQSPSSLLRIYMPLCQAMMFNSSFFSMHSTASDLVRFLEANSFHVFEHTAVIDGSECLLVANMGFQFYLDMDKSFAVRQLDSFAFDYVDADAGAPMAIRRRKLSDRRIHSEFTDYGNGVWLPLEMKLTHFLRGDEPEDEYISVVSMEVNPEIDGSVFVDIIPNDAFVADGTRGMTYIYGDRSSIEELVRSNVPDKTGTLSMIVWINVAVIVAIVSVFLVVWIMRRRAT